MNKNILLLFPLLLFATLAACKQFSGSDRDAPAVELIGSELKGVWVVEYIAERPVVDRSPARIHFGDDNSLNGNASCNRFFGKYRYNDKDLIIEPLGSTKMACVPALMEQEQRFLETLPRATRVTIEQGLLILRDGEDRQILKASRDESGAE